MMGLVEAAESGEVAARIFALDAGYRVERGGESDGDLNEKWWWTLARPGMDVGASPGEFDTEADAWADAVRAMKSEMDMTNEECAPTPNHAGTLFQGVPDAGMQKRRTVRADESGSSEELAQSAGGAGSAGDRASIQRALQEWRDAQPIDTYSYDRRFAEIQEEIEQDWAAGNSDGYSGKFGPDHIYAMLREEDPGQYFDSDGDLTDAGGKRYNEVERVLSAKITRGELGEPRRREVDLGRPDHMAEFLHWYLDTRGFDPHAIGGSGKSLSKYFNVPVGPGDYRTIRISDHKLPGEYDVSDLELALYDVSDEDVRADGREMSTGIDENEAVGRAARLVEQIEHVKLQAKTRQERIMQLTYTANNPFDKPNMHFGSFILDSGEIVHLCQEAYLAGTNETPIYRASGYLASENPDDETGPTVQVSWEPVEEWRDMEDESDVCDWGTPFSIAHYSNGELMLQAKQIAALGKPNFDGSGVPIAGRYYVYQGNLCSEWLEYDDLDSAKRENPGKWVMDAKTREAVPETRGSPNLEESNMKSTPTPWTHAGVTARQLTITFGATGSRLKYEVTVPAGTICHKLDGGSDPWVVGDLSFISDKHSILYHDADHYGIRIPESEIIGIVEKGQVLSEDVRLQRLAAQVKGRMIVEHIKDFSPAELERCLGATVAPELCLKVGKLLIDGGMTMEQLYEGVDADVDGVFNVLVQAGKDVSLEEAKALAEKFTQQDHFAFLTAKTSADALAVVQAAQDRAALQANAASEAQRTTPAPGAAAEPDDSPAP